MLTFTEIGGAGEMIYKAVRFPDYYWEFDYEIKEDRNGSRGAFCF